MCQAMKERSVDWQQLITNTRHKSLLKTEQDNYLQSWHASQAQLVTVRCGSNEGHAYQITQVWHQETSWNTQVQVNLNTMLGDRE